MSVAFVLSGGASLGAAQAGMVEALYERNIRPDLLVGTSVGAINAAFLASRPPTVETAHELQHIWRRLRRSDVFPANPITAGLGMLGLRDHTVSAGALRQLIGRHLEFEHLQDAPVALHVIASDALTGEEVRLSSGRAVDAIAASAAIPGVFPPVRWGSQLLADGAVANNTPLSHAAAIGADQIIVLQAMGTPRLQRPPRSVAAAGMTAVARILTRRLTDDLARYGTGAELVILSAPDLGCVLPTDFGRADDLITGGRRRARASLRTTERRTRRVVTLRRAA